MTISLPEGLSSALLADAGARVLPTTIKPLVHGWCASGPAFTVHVEPGDNLAVHAALAHIKSGEVLLVEAGGTMERAIMGDIMCTQASLLRLAGVVIHGAIRDSADLRKGTLPVFAKGTSPAGPGKQGPGAVLQPITMGTVPVNPGDYVFGDDDGVVVFSPDEAASIIAAAQKKKIVETTRLTALRNGHMQPDWLADALNRYPISMGERKSITP